MHRRSFILNSAAGAAGLTVGAMSASAEDAAAPIVFFSKTITSEKAIELFKLLKIELKGKVAIKTHSGEPNGKHFLQPEFLKPLVDLLNAAIVECNTAYPGRRMKTEDHWKVVEEHGFTKIGPVDILDAEEEYKLEIPNGLQIKTNYVGANIVKYDSMLVTTHFKGHQMGGFGGALKNISIGLASSHGKAYIHGAGDPSKMWTCPQDRFLESMADASSSILERFKGQIAFINVMKNLSIDCDCNGHPKAPEMADIGILASLDPVALDQACVDLVYNSPDKGKASLIERMESRNAIHILEAAEQLGIGSRTYKLVEVE